MIGIVSLMSLALPHSDDCTRQYRNMSFLSTLSSLGGEGSTSSKHITFIIRLYAMFDHALDV